MAQELTLGPIPYKSGTFVAANVSGVGDFCRLTDNLFFSIYRQTTPDFVYAQITSVDNIRASTPLMTVLRTQHLLEFTSTDTFTDTFNCVKLSDQFVAVVCKPAVSGTVFQIRIFYIDPALNPDYTYDNTVVPPTYKITNHQYAVTQVGDPIIINDVFAGTGVIGARPYLLNPIVDNVMFFEYQNTTGFTRVLKRLEFTPNFGDLSLSTTTIVTITNIPSATGTLAYSVPFFARHHNTGKWTATWTYSPNTPATCSVLVAAFDPKASTVVAPTTVTNAQGQAFGNKQAVAANMVMLPRGDKEGILFNATAPYQYDTMLNGVCTGIKKAYGETTTGTNYVPRLGWWLDEKHFVLVATYLANQLPNARSWQFAYSGGATTMPIVRVCQYIDRDHISMSYGTSVSASQFTSTNTTNYATFWIYPYKTELYGDDTIVFYGYDTTQMKWMIKTCRLSV